MTSIFKAPIYLVYIYLYMYSSIAVAGDGPKIQITERTWSDVLLESQRLDVGDTELSLFRDSTEMFSLLSNTNISGGTNRIRFLQFRGVGETSQFENTPNFSVAYSVNGIDLTGLMAHWPMLDIESLRVHKYSKSVDYGGSAIGGSIETTLLDDQDNLKVLASLDSRESYRASFGAPLGRHRWALHINQDSGYITNTYKNQGGDTQQEIYSSLVSRWINTQVLQVKTTLISANFDNHYDVWSLKNDQTTGSDRPGKDDLSLIGGSLSVRYNMDSEKHWGIESSHVQAHTFYSYDADWSNNSFWNTVQGWNQDYDYYDQFDRHREQSQWRLFWGGASFELGLHAQRLEEDSEIQNYKRGALRSFSRGSFEQASLAFYVKKDWYLKEDMSLVTSGRVDGVETKFHDEMSTKESWTSPQWSFDIEWLYKESNKSVWFSTLRYGFKNPMVNIDTDVVVSERRVESEKAIHLEVGHKYIFERGVFLQSLFARQGWDQQVRVSVQPDIQDPSSYMYFYDNAAQTKYVGYEALFERDVLRSSTLYISLGLLKAEFSGYSFEGRDLSGRELAHAPRSTWALRWTTLWGQRWRISVVAEGKSSFYFSNNHDQENPSYVLAHSSLQYFWGAHSIDVGVRNMGDAAYSVRAFYFANEPPDFPQKLYTQSGVPRTFYINYRLGL